MAAAAAAAASTAGFEAWSTDRLIGYFAASNISKKCLDRLKTDRIIGAELFIIFPDGPSVAAFTKSYNFELIDERRLTYAIWRVASTNNLPFPNSGIVTNNKRGFESAAAGGKADSDDDDDNIPLAKKLRTDKKLDKPKSKSNKPKSKSESKPKSSKRKRPKIDYRCGFEPLSSKSAAMKATKAAVAWLNKNGGASKVVSFRNAAGVINGLADEAKIVGLHMATVWRMVMKDFPDVKSRGKAGYCLRTAADVDADPLSDVDEEDESDDGGSNEADEDELPAAASAAAAAAVAVAVAEPKTKTKNCGLAGCNGRCWSRGCHAVTADGRCRTKAPLVSGVFQCAYCRDHCAMLSKGGADCGKHPTRGVNRHSANRDG